MANGAISDARAAEETAGGALAEAALVTEAKPAAETADDGKPSVTTEVAQSSSKVSIEIPESEGGSKHSKIAVGRTRSKPDVEVDLQRFLMEAGVEAAANK